MATAAGTALIPVAGRAGNKPIPASRVSRHTRRRRLAVAGAVQLAMFGIGYGVFSALQGSDPIRRKRFATLARSSGSTRPLELSLPSTDGLPGCPGSPSSLPPCMPRFSWFLP